VFKGEHIARYPPLPPRKRGKMPHRRENHEKFSKLLDDIDIPGDIFYLAKYRSFHNHEVDANVIEYSNLVMDNDLHRKGAVTILPQGPKAI
jgi:hypothetical protein